MPGCYALSCFPLFSPRVHFIVRKYLAGFHCVCLVSPSGELSVSSCCNNHLQGVDFDVNLLVDSGADFSDIHSMEGRRKRGGGGASGSRKIKEWEWSKGKKKK